MAVPATLGTFGQDLDPGIQLALRTHLGGPRVTDVRVGLSRPQPEPQPSLVRHERLRKPREGPLVPGAQARGEKLGDRGGDAGERRNDPLAVANEK